MKKLIAIMLCSGMMMSFGACSAFSSEEEIRGEQISNEEVLEENEIENTEQEFSMGKTEDLVYENKFIGIGCTLENNWHFYSDEEIMELNNYTADVAGEEFEEIMQNADLIYDMYAISDNQLDNINVNLEKMSKLRLGSLIIEDELEKGIPVLEDAFKNMGYSNFQAELDTVSIEGEELTCLYTSAEIDGLKMYQKIFPIKCNGYLATITVTTYEENTVDSIMERFYFIK